MGGFAANKVEFCDFKNKDNIIKNYYENPKNVCNFGHKKIIKRLLKSLQNKKIKPLAEQSIESLKILHSLCSSIIVKKFFTKKNKFLKIN